MRLASTVFPAHQNTALALQAPKVERVLPVERAEVLQGQRVNIDFGHGQAF